MRKPRAADLLIYAALAASAVWVASLARRSTPIATVLANHDYREVGDTTSWERTQDVREYWVRADFGQLQREVRHALAGHVPADPADCWHESSTSAAWCLFRGIVRPSMARQGYPAGPDECVSLIQGRADLASRSADPKAPACGWCTLIYVSDKPSPSRFALAFLRLRHMFRL